MSTRRLATRSLRLSRHLIAAALLLAPTVACGQSSETPPVRRSQRGSVVQRVGATRITIEYGRPVARGRELFGGIVHWGVVWCPGADTATSITTTTPISINGATLPEGTYSVWAEPNPERWTIIFSKATPTWHVPYPSGQDVLRVPATPRKGEHMETLAFYFPVVDGRKAQLALHWGTTVVPMEIEVPE